MVRVSTLCIYSCLFTLHFLVFLFLLPAESLNYPVILFQYLQSLQKPDGSNTMSVFGEYLNYPHSSVGKVISALEEMNRDDVAKILKDALPSMYYTYLTLMLLVANLAKKNDAKKPEK